MTHILSQMDDEAAGSSASGDEYGSNQKGIHITRHAQERYAERIMAADPTSTLEDVAKLSRTIEMAIEFGCSTVVMRNGARLVVRDGCVITVLPKRSRPKRRER